MRIEPPVETSPDGVAVRIGRQYHREIVEVTWGEVDVEGSLIRLSPTRSKTGLGSVLPISQPLSAVLKPGPVFFEPCSLGHQFGDLLTCFAVSSFGHDIDIPDLCR